MKKQLEMMWSRRGKTLLLACGKCQRKLRREDDADGLSRLKKTLKREVKRQGTPLRLTVIETSCLKVCPKGGVVVATTGQLVRGQCGIVRSVEDLAGVLKLACRTDKRIDDDLGSVIP